MRLHSLKSGLLKIELSPETRPLRLFHGRTHDTKPSWLSIILTILFFFFISVNAQTLPTGSPLPGSQVQDPCAPPPLKDETGCMVKQLKIEPLVNLYNKLFSNDLHAVTGNIVPGSGFSLGIGYGKETSDSTNPDVTITKRFDVSTKVSTKKYWEVDSNFRLTRARNQFGAASEMKLNLYGLFKDLRRLDFYGLGPESRKQDRAVFHYQEAVLGIDFSNPVKPWLDIGGAIEGILPNIKRIDDPTVRSVERAFTEASAPGIASQPAFLHLVAFAGFQTTGQPESATGAYRFFYHYYRDLQDQRYSFRRFDADLSHKFPFGKNELRLRGRFSFSGTSGGQVVPFYLMQTLGGSNLSGVDTLRGFSDYRFRDRDSLLAQADFLRQLYGPIKLNVFYDAGKVKGSFSPMGNGRVRQTWGLGFAIAPRTLESYLFRFYIAFGSGEGAHPYVGSGDLPRGKNRLVR